jgi:hypothetical protein
MNVITNVRKFVNYTGQQKKKKKIISMKNMLSIYLFAFMKLEKGRKKNLAPLSKLC